LGKRLDDSLSRAGFAASYLPNRYANLIQRKRNKYTKREGLSGRPRPASIQAIIIVELRQSAKLRLFVTFAEKKRKKMIRSKQIT
jgi:hypothetical protein